MVDNHLCFLRFGYDYLLEISEGYFLQAKQENAAFW